jgi:biotin carboxyl carrier protein
MWRVEVKVGDGLENERIVAVLEAMKLDVPIKAGERRWGGGEGAGEIG